MILKKPSQIIISLMALLFVLSACGGLQPDPANTNLRTTTFPAGEDPKSTNEAADSPPFSTEGHVLLIQTDFDTYEFIGIEQNQRTLFEQPGTNQGYDLKNAISPGGNLIMVQTSDEEVIVKSLVSDEVHTSIDIPTNSRLFSIEKTLEILLKSFPDLNMTGEELQAAISDAYHTSISTFKWSDNSHHVLIALPGSETSTNLHIHDTHSDSNLQLENEDGIVEDFWISPDQDHILLKKGYFIDPTFWEDDSYFLLNLKERSVRRITLPGDVDRPSVFWFSPTHLGIIHELALVGGNRFSLLDIHTFHAQLVLPGSFKGLFNLGEALLSLHQNAESHTTLFKITNLSGDLLRSQELYSVCQMNTLFNENECLISCEKTSYRLDLDTLSTDDFDDPIRMISFNPDSTQFIYLDIKDQITLCENPPDNCRQLALENVPVEILWLPDSSGFLYRAANNLFYYDLSSLTEKRLLASDIFGDYRNLNAVWLNIGNP